MADKEKIIEDFTAYSQPAKLGSGTKPNNRITDSNQRKKLTKLSHETVYTPAMVSRAA